MFHLKIISFAIVVLSCTAVFADEQRQFDVSQAWFKPELLVNNQPEICEPIFKSYVNYFISPATVNPLMPISTREEHNLGALTDKISELEWASIGNEEKGLRLAQWRQDGKYFGIVERSYAIGWRPPTYEYYLIDKPLSDTDVANGAKERYGEGSISYMDETVKPGIFDLIYESDSRYKNFKQNIFVQVANVYSSNHRVYLALSANKSYELGPTVHLIASVITPRQIKLVCKFTTLPSSNAIRNESGKIAYYKDFEEVVLKIMGGGGNCGTLNAPAWAMHELREGLDSLIFRPWTYMFNSETYDFSRWGYSGAWNYRKYLEFNTLLPKAQHGLADKYVKDYRLEKNHALTLAGAGISAALKRGFSHGLTEDEYEGVHRALLEGKTAEEVLLLLPNHNAIKDEYGDSLLAFAIGHPHLVELLLKRGFDPNKTNAFGKTSLMYAAQFNDLKSAKLLVKYGANTELVTTQPSDNCNYTITTTGVTALHYAVRYASKDFIEWLVQIGAVTSVQDSNRNTPLDYLTKFGGFVGYKKTAEESYGKQNFLLTKSHIDSLTTLLTPLSEEKRQLASDEANRKAESLYQSGKIREAYMAIKRSLSLNSKNERALLNLSLISLKLEYHGESAKAATYIVKNSHSEKERASAYFNLGLSCQAAGKNYHYATITYDGKTYCQERWDRYHGPLYYYLKAYQTSPTKSRANAIVAFLEAVDNQHGKWLCKAGDSDSNLRSVYIVRNYVYFLTKTGVEIDYQQLAMRDHGGDNTLDVTKKEVFPLENGFSVFRWEVNVPFQSTLVLGDKLCSNYLPSMIDDGTELIELHAYDESKPITVSSNTSKPIVLVLYGNKVNWTISNDSQNIRAIYVHGKDATLQYPDKMPVAVHMDTKLGAYSEPWGSSFNVNIETTIGLKIGAIVNLRKRQQIQLDDAMLYSLPRCDTRFRTNCRTH